MTTFESSIDQPDSDKEWEAYVAKLSEFLHRERTATEFDDPSGDSYSETYDESHAAAKALADVEAGDFEAASVYLDQEIEKVEGDIRAARDDQSRLAPLEVRKSQLETLRSGLERQ